MAMEGLLWRGGGWTPVAESESRPTVVDSWLVTDGWMRAPRRHVDRFAAACGEPAAAEFCRAALRRIPVTGAWFPRVELVGSTFHLLLRPAPPLGDTVRLWLPPTPDRRTRPTVKGPDLDDLLALRRFATERGADEAVLCAADGRLREGATTSILWWRGDVLCAPPPDDTILPGVTRAVIEEIAAATAVPVRYETCPPRELAGLETWAVNALHGLRPVTGWVGNSVDTAITPGTPHRAPGWRARLAATRVPVGGAPVR